MSDKLEQIKKLFPAWNCAVQMNDARAQQILGICQPQCKWKMDSNPDYDVWDSTCGNSFILNEGSPKDNDMNYCPYCGGKLIQVPEDKP